MTERGDDALSLLQQFFGSVVIAVSILLVSGFQKSRRGIESALFCEPPERDEKSRTAEYAECNHP